MDLRVQTSEVLRANGRARAGRLHPDPREQEPLVLAHGQELRQGLREQPDPWAGGVRREDQVQAHSQGTRSLQLQYGKEAAAGKAADHLPSLSLSLATITIALRPLNSLTPFPFLPPRSADGKVHTQPWPVGLLTAHPVQERHRGA